MVVGHSPRLIRLGVQVVVVLLLTLAGPASVHAASISKGKRPVVLLFHPGGFVLGDGDLMQQAAVTARQNGFNAIKVEYLKRAGSNIPLQVRSSAELAKRLNRRGRQVYAYGESAGGLIAARLAQRGVVRAAALQAPVSSLPKYLQDAETRDPGISEVVGLPTRRSQQKFSPSKHPTRRPIFAFAAAEDSLSLPTLKWAERDRFVRSRTVAGEHLEHRQAVTQMAISWLVKRRPRDVMLDR